MPKLSRTYNNRSGINTSDKAGRSWLYQAVKSGDHKNISKLLKSGANPNLQNHKRRAPLHVAVENNDFTAVSMLLEHGACVEIGAVENITPLMLSMDSSVDIRIVRALLNHVQDVHYTDSDGYTVAHYWAQFGDAERFSLLLAKGVDFNMASKISSYRPVHIAIPQNLKLLSAQGVDIFAKTIKSKTSLHIAAKNGDLDSAEVLLSALEKDYIGRYSSVFKEKDFTPLMEAASNGHLDVVERLLEFGFDANQQNWYGQTALFFAVIKQHEDVVRTLVRHGADVNGFDLKNRNQKNLLHYAVELGHEGIFHFLLEAGAAIDTKDSQKYTPLFRAVMSMNVGFVKALLEAGANPNIAALFGNRPIDVIAGRAPHKEAIEITKLLIDAGADVGPNDEFYDDHFPIHSAINSACLPIVDLIVKTDRKNLELRQEDDPCFTPFLFAVSENRQNIAAMLLKHGADKDALDVSRKNALHLSVIKGNDKTALWLIQDMALNVNAQDLDLQTPLHYAVENYDVELMQILVFNGADLTLKNKDGKTPLDIAIEQNDDDVVDYFKTVMKSNDNNQQQKILPKRPKKTQKYWGRGI